MCVLAMAVNLILAATMTTSVSVADTGSIVNTGDSSTSVIAAAIIAAVASIVNALILTSVRNQQSTIKSQQTTIRRHVERMSDLDQERDSQIVQLRVLSLERERQIAVLETIAARMAGHMDRLETREKRVRNGD